MKTKPIIRNFLTRAAMTLGAVLMTSATAWADEWEETTKTLTVTTDPSYGAYKDRTDIEHVVISSEVSYIEEETFSGCTGLTSVTFDGNSKLESIQDKAFKGCTSLTSVTLPDGLISIGTRAFSGCMGLTAITFDSTSQLESIGSQAFEGCTGLTSVTFDGTSQLERIGDQAFKGCTGLTSVTFDGTSQLESISEQAFSGCTGLTSVTFDGTSQLESIDFQAFEGCTGLTSVILPDGLKYMWDKAFKGCTGLTSVTLPDGLLLIGTSAFEGCTSLTAITIPSSVQDVHAYAFKDCTNMTTVLDLAVRTKTSYAYKIDGVFVNVSSSCHFYVHSELMYELNVKKYADRMTVISGITTLAGAIATTTAEPFITDRGIDYYTPGTQFTLSHGDAVPLGYCGDFQGYQVKSSSGNDITSTALNGTTLTLPDDGDVTVKALYDLVEYTITYDLDGGEIEGGVGNIAYPTTYTIESREIRIDKMTLMIVPPHKNGYNFLGWTGPGYDEPTKLIIIPSGSYGDRTYTAHWQIINYTISYDLNGGSLPEGVTNPTTYTVETETITLNNPTRKGHDFIGWIESGKVLADENIVRTIPKGSYGNMSLIAEWHYLLDDVIYLADNADNAALISEYEELSVDVTLQGRTLYRDGDWNTLCLPFDVNSFADTPLADATVKELNEETSNLDSNGKLTLNFKDATSIKAGKPYIVKWKVADVLIRSIEDWNAFAANVAGGNTYENQTVKLMADIGTSQNPVTTMISGTFKGTFDGGGHSINAVIRGSGDGTALFYHINGATIQNLRVEGWIKTDGIRPANIAAFVSGVSTISNCSCWADIESTKKNSKIDGGTVVGLINAGATLNMTDIYSRASITYVNTSYGGGGIVGWTGSTTAKANLERCLYSPNEVDIKKIGSEPSYYFVSGPGQKNLTKCVYDNNVETSVLTSQGTSVLTAQGTRLNLDLTDILKYLSWDKGYDPSLNLPMAVPDNLENPVFKNVTIDATAPAPVAFDGGTFTGTYSPLDSTTGLLFDEHNPSNGACRAYLNIDAPALDGFDGWYTDAEITTPVSTIPFDADGTVKLYAKLAGSQQLVGDANGNGKVDAADIVEMVNAMNGNVSTNFNWDNADFDGNHTITDYDINEVVKIIMGE